MTEQRWQDVTPPPGEPGERDWGRMAFETATAHLRAISDAEDCAEGECPVDDPTHTGEVGAPQCESPANGYGCQGCNDCTVREVLTVSWPIVEAAVRSGDFDR